MTNKMTQTFPVAASQNILRGESLKFSSGNVTRATDSGEWVFGFAATDADNSSGSAGDIDVGVIFSGEEPLPTMVTETDAAGNFSSPIVAGDALQIVEVGAKLYVAKAFADTSTIVGYALEANAGSDAGLTVTTSPVLIIAAKAQKSNLLSSS